MQLRVRDALVLSACLAFASASPATAQTTQSMPSTPFIIHGVTLDGAEQVALKNQALLAQPVTSVRSARLDAEAPAERAGWFKQKSFPAGTPMFGAYTRDGWSYCAVAESRAAFWTSDQFICYVDSDNDGQFESALDSGAPFGGVPLLVFGQGQPSALPVPVPYSRIPTIEGPSVEYAVGYELVRPSGRGMRNGRNVPLPATHIIPFIGFKIPGGDIRPLSGPGEGRRFALERGQTATIRLGEAVIEILGVGDDDSVRYRVIQAFPAQVDQITLRITSSTYWVAY